jgi:uncharacterized membrane protein
MSRFEFVAVGRWMLGQQESAPAGGQRSTDILVILGIVVALAVLVVIVALVIRRQLGKSQDVPQMAEGFSLGDLRQLHRKGKISDEEYAATKALVVAQSRSAFGDDESSEDMGLTYRTPSPSSMEDDLGNNFAPEPDKNTEDGSPGTSG